MLVGITGGIGTGKTEVCKTLARKGFKVYYSDLVAKNLYLTDKTLAKRIVKVFGKGILNYKGKINLHKLKDAIFSTKKNYQTINKIVHPVVIKYLLNEARKSKFDVIVFESALIFESGFHRYLDYIVTVYSNKKNRMNRLMVRDEANKNAINHLMKFQIDEKKKMALSDFVIINNKSLDYLKIQSELLGTILNSLRA